MNSDAMDKILNHSGHDHEHHNHENCHQHKHSHEHDELNEVEVLRLVLDDDTELECYVLGIFEVGNKEYISLLPIDQDQMLLYEYQKTEDGLQLLNIEDEAVYELVAKAFKAQTEDELDAYE